MKLKYYLRGLGIGIIVTTIILTISFSGRQPQMSDDEVIARAKELGMVVTENKISSGIPKDTEALHRLEADDTEVIGSESLTEPESEGNDTELADTESGDTEIAAEPTSDTESTAPQDTAPEAEAEQTEDTDTLAEDVVAETPAESTSEIAVTVANGSPSNVVANQLYVLGLIDDAEAFNRYLVENQFAAVIQTGTFMIPQGADYYTIAMILTN